MRTRGLNMNMILGIIWKLKALRDKILFLLWLLVIQRLLREEYAQGLSILLCFHIKQKPCKGLISIYTKTIPPIFMQSLTCPKKNTITLNTSLKTLTTSEKVYSMKLLKFILKLDKTWKSISAFPPDLLM